MMKTMCVTLIKWVGIICISLIVAFTATMGIMWGVSTNYKLYGVPVLNYHQVNDTNQSPLTVTVDEFREQMDYLHRNGYHTISLDELYTYLVEGASLPDRPVLITFDDGYVDNYENVLPILEAYHMKATLFMISDAVNTNRFVTLTALKQMEANGFSVEGHTNHHHILTQIDSQQWPEEIKGGKTRLERMINKDISYLAYPGGFNNKSIQQVVADSGYKMAFTVNPGTIKPGDNLYALPRIPIFHNDMTYISFLMRLHCEPFIEATWNLRDRLVSHGHTSVAKLVPLF